MATSPEQGAERRNMTNSKRRPRIKQELVMEIDGIFARGRTTAEVRRIGEERRARYDDEHGGLAGGPPLYECSRTMLALAKIGLEMASDEDIRRLTLMDPVLFFYVVAMVEEALERNPGLLLFEGGGPRASDAGRRAKLQPIHIVLLYLRYAKTNMTQHEVAAEFGLGQKTVSRYVGLAKALLAAVLPTPRAYEEHLRGLTDPQEIKRHLPGPGRGACIEDGTLVRMQRPGQRQSRDNSFNGRKKIHCANTQLRLSLKNLAVSLSPTVNGTVNDIAMCKNHPLNLGLATANMGDKDALPGDRFLRIHDSGFRGAEKAYPGARCERTVGRRALEKMDEEGRARNAEISRKRLPVEWFFGRMKRYKRIAGPYAGTYSELNGELNVVAGLVNLHIMHGGVRPGRAHAKGPDCGRVRPHRRNIDRDRREICKEAGVDYKEEDKKAKAKKAKKARAKAGAKGGT